MNNNEKLPLRKCLQCKQLKREELNGQKCQACYDQNKQDARIVTYNEHGLPLPGLDRNLIYQPRATTLPEPHDYLWHFLKWLYNLKIGPYMLNYHTSPCQLEEWSATLSENNERLRDFYQVGNPHPRWYDKNGNRLPAYESLLLTGYDAEIRCEREE